jgi:hypothetical protein
MDRVLIACSCGLDPAAETMAVQAGIAFALSAPIWFRQQITDTARRACRRLMNRPGEGPGDEDSDSDAA